MYLPETTRKYPGLPFLNRQCTQDFKVPNSKFTIKKDTNVIISLLGLHRDAKYFPEPLAYKPERFADETKDYDAAAYMPFGEGPRHCIGKQASFIRFWKNSNTSLYLCLQLSVWA